MGFWRDSGITLAACKYSNSPREAQNFYAQAQLLAGARMITGPMVVMAAGIGERNVATSCSAVPAAITSNIVDGGADR